jgi:CubicO group peptidase (beta-lactamase class C family)
MTMNNQIQELFDKAVKTSGAAGVQLSIIEGREQVDFVSGFANAELDIPMTQDTVIQIGSVTKVFNAMMVMSLVEAGQLELDVPVKRYIPEFELSDPKATPAITLRHLLSMSAGLDNGDYGDYGEGEDAIARRVMGLGTLPQHFTPGAYFGYSNAGSDVAGYVAERVTGRIWDDLLKERVLAPAGLTNAVSLDRDRLFHRVSVGHRLDTESGEIQVIRPWCLQSRGQAPGGCSFATSAHDLARFGRLFIDKGLTDSGIPVLSESAIKTMMTPHMDVPVHYWATSWCLGPCMHEWDRVAVWGHHGGATSGGSFLYWVPEKNGVIACTYNTPSVYARLVKVMTQDVMNAAFGVANPVMKAPTSSIKIDPKRYTGTYECLAAQCLVEMADDDLVMTKRYQLLGGTEIVDTVSLIPLGGDRFLMDKGAETDPLVLPEDIAFFGDDGHGRASNMTHAVFPASRKS